MFNLLASYTTVTSSGSSITSTLIVGLIYALLIIFIGIIPLWIIFKKFHKPGWAAIIPIYDTWVLFEIVGFPGWWSILIIVPIINLFPAVMTLVSYYKLAKLFGKSNAFAICSVLFTFVTLPILAYGKSQPVDSDAGSTPPPVASATPIAPSEPVSPAANVDAAQTVTPASAESPTASAEPSPAAAAPASPTSEQTVISPQPSPEATPTDNPQPPAAS